jgi:nicotinate-nucleotide pyrophosphorylase (carboxylating)
MIDHELIKRALAEDLQGGEDITSVATVSGSD